MPFAPLELLPKLVSSFHPALLVTDLFDILIIAALIYLILLLLRQTRSLFILLGIFLLAALYTAAKIFNLYLTSVALQTVFSFLFLIIIVIFQNEIRRFFELIGLLGTRQTKTDPRSITHITQTLANVCDQASKNKTGALIVITRKEDVSSHSSGGQICDSLISEELLESIFDPHSPGHDGAAIIKSNRLFKFGVHLPLSTNFKEVGKHGTRHSAALGISEVSDAIAIVVSEEKGTISVATHGKLKTLSGASDLLNFLQKNLTPPPAFTKKTLLHQIVAQHLSLKIVSLLTAVIIWIVFAYRAVPLQRTVKIPVSFENLPDGLQIQEFIPKDVSLTLQSRNSEVLDSINQQNLKLKLDAGNLKTGLNSLSVKTADIEKPLNVDLLDINPSTVYLSAQKFSLLEIPVEVKTTGSPGQGYKISSISATPQSVRVWIPEGESVPSYIPTEQINISAAKKDILVESQLQLPPKFRLQKPEQSQISVAVVISPK